MNQNYAWVSVIIVLVVLGGVFYYYRAPAPTVGACYVGGCSSQLCTSDHKAVSTCEYTEAYACYGRVGAKCERQTSGVCGWTMTPALQQCLAEANAPQPLPISL